jgi:hypothetical protein
VRFAAGEAVPTVGVDASHLSDEWTLQAVHVFQPSVVFSAYVTRA